MTALLLDDALALGELGLKALDGGFRRLGFALALSKLRGGGQVALPGAKAGAPAGRLCCTTMTGMEAARAASMARPMFGSDVSTGGWVMGNAPPEKYSFCTSMTIKALFMEGSFSAGWGCPDCALAALVRPRVQRRSPITFGQVAAARRRPPGPCTPTSGRRAAR